MSTLDLRHPFKNNSISWKEPATSLRTLSQMGVTRILLPCHWRSHPWEQKEVVASWVKEAHRMNMKVLIYTGPFGTEPNGEVDKHPEWQNWFQLKSDGKLATYHGLYMFCPHSPYLMEHRLPIILELINEIPFDGLFFDIPWLVEGACFCAKCNKARADNLEAPLTFQEQTVRVALQKAVKKIRRKRSDFWLSINVSAPAVWDSRKTGATPQSLAGLFDELVVEWTPSSDGAVKSIESSIDLTKKADPMCRISHAYTRPKSEDVQLAIYEVHHKTKASRWLTDLKSVPTTIE